MFKLFYLDRFRSQLDFGWLSHLQVKRKNQLHRKRRDHIVYVYVISGIII
jgi:hypothetical protein